MSNIPEPLPAGANPENDGPDPAADDAPSLLLRAAAHDVRGSLSNLIGFADLAGRASVPAEKRLSNAAIAATSARELARRITGLLEIAGATSTASARTRVPTQLRDFIDDCVSQARKLAPRQTSEAPLTITVDEAVPEWIEVSADRCEHVLVECLGAALRGRRSQPVVVRACLTDGWLEVTLTASDLGVAAERLTQLWELAQQGATADDAGGIPRGPELHLQIAARMAVRAGGMLAVAGYTPDEVTVLIRFPATR